MKDVKNKENIQPNKDPFYSLSFIRSIFSRTEKVVWYFTCSFIASFLILHFSSAHPHTCTSLLTPWLMKNLVIKGLPTACDLKVLPVTGNSNNTRNPFIQLHRAAWWNYSYLGSQVFHCSPCFTYLSDVILLRWVCPVLLKGPQRKLMSVF